MRLYAKLFHVIVILFLFHYCKSNSDDLDVYTLLSGRINLTDLALSEMETKLLNVQTELDNFKQSVYYDNSRISLNITLIMEEIKEMKNENSDQWTFLRHMMSIVDSNVRTDANLYHELSLIRSDIAALKDQQDDTNHVMLDHLAKYIQQIDNAVEDIERCQTGTSSLHDYPTAPIPGSKHVTFSRPFHQKPTMAWGVIKADVENDFNLRYSVSLVDITKTGFTFKALTWSDSVVYGLYVRWIACPA